MNKGGGAATSRGQGVAVEEVGNTSIRIEADGGSGAGERLILGGRGVGSKIASFVGTTGSFSTEILQDRVGYFLLLITESIISRSRSDTSPNKEIVFFNYPGEEAFCIGVEQTFDGENIGELTKESVKYFLTTLLRKEGQSWRKWPVSLHTLHLKGMP